METSAELLTPRRNTRQISVGKVAVGGGAPISVQSMTTTKTADVEGTLQQIYQLAAAGADIVRCTCNKAEAAEGLAQIIPRSPVPIVADIHFHVEMALAALEAGVDGLRLNPGNLRKPSEIKLVAQEAKDREKGEGQFTVNVNKMGGLEALGRSGLEEATLSKLIKDDYSQVKKLNPNASYRVLIRADKDLGWEKTKVVLKAAAAAGVANVVFATTKGGKG